MKVNFAGLSSFFIPEINEEGTEGAASTLTIHVPRKIEAPTVFHADHPFMYAIRHDPSNLTYWAL